MHNVDRLNADLDGFAYFLMSDGTYYTWWSSEPDSPAHGDIDGLAQALKQLTDHANTVPGATMRSLTLFPDVARHVAEAFTLGKL